MRKVFRQRLKDAIRVRRRAKLPNIGWLVLGMAALTVLYCFLAIYLVPSNKPPDFNFQEGGAVTALSAIYLASACGLAIAANLIHRRAEGRHQWFWTILAGGLAFLAFDELLQFHERVDRLVIERLLPEAGFQSWNDLIVVIYGLVAVLIMFFLLPALLKYRMVPELFAVAFIFYAIHTLIDSVQTTSTLTSIVLEESAKLVSVAFLALGTLAGFLGNLRAFVKVPADKQILSEPETARLPSDSLKTDVVERSPANDENLNSLKIVSN